MMDPKDFIGWEPLQQKVLPERAAKAVSLLRRMLSSLREEDLIQSLVEIGLIECLDYTSTGHPKLNCTDLQMIAMAAALAAVNEAKTALDISKIEIVS